MGEEVRDELVTAMIALGELVIPARPLKLQVDTLPWNRRRAQLHLELVRRVRQARLVLRNHDGVAEVQFIMNEHICGNGNRRIRGRSPLQIQKRRAELLDLDGVRPVTGLAQVRGLLNDRIHPRLGQNRGKRRRWQGVDRREILDHPAHGQRLTHRHLGNPHLAALANHHFPRRAIENPPLVLVILVAVRFSTDVRVFFNPPADLIQGRRLRRPHPHPLHVPCEQGLLQYATQTVTAFFQTHRLWPQSNIRQYPFM